MTVLALVRNRADAYHLSIKQLAIRLATEGPHKTLSTLRLVQAIFNKSYIVRTTAGVLVWEIPFYPQLYIPTKALTSSPSSDLKAEPGDAIKDGSGTVVAHQWTIAVGDRSTDQVVAFADNLSGKAAPLAGLAKIDFGAMDQWFEESTPIYVHPKDPFKRVDILASTRPVAVSVGGIEVARSTSSMHLYETGLPVRYYLPLTSIRPDVLRPSDLRTRCPYKGEAEYYHVQVDGKLFENIVWYYRQPTLESAKVEGKTSFSACLPTRADRHSGLCCFYNEKVTIELDGETLEQPITPFSKAKPGEKPSGV